MTAAGRITKFEQQIADLTANFERLREEALTFKTFSEMRPDRLGYPPALKADRHRARTGSRHLRPVGSES